MGEFKNEFKQVFEYAPRFSKKAQNQVKDRLQKRKHTYWIVPSVVVVAVTLFITIGLMNKDLFSGTTKLASSKFAPEHEIILTVLEDFSENNETQIVLSNQKKTMNRGNKEYEGNIIVETANQTPTYGQIILYEIEKNVYDLSRVVALEGDRVKIDNGQIYLNNKKINAYYGRAQIFGETTVEEAYKATHRFENILMRNTIEEILSFSMDEVTLQKGEIFVVEDNWIKNRTGKIVKNPSIFGTVVGYSHEGLAWKTGRPLKKDEMYLIDLAKQVVTAFEQKDSQALQRLSASDKRIDIEKGKFYDVADINKLFDYGVVIEELPITENIVLSEIHYLQRVDMTNRNIIMDNYFYIEYAKEDGGSLLLSFVLENGEYKFDGIIN